MTRVCVRARAGARARARACVCVGIQYHSVRPVVKYTSRGFGITVTRLMSSKSSRAPIFAKQTSRGYSMTNIGVVPCTEHRY